MELIQGWVGALVLTLTAACAALAWWIAPRAARTSTGSRVAMLDRVRALPAFRALARREWRARAVESAALALALAGVALMGARWVGISDEADELRTREVVLCLDVSGSMRELDADVVDTYRQLVAELDEERIGLVVFDAYAVTLFPLTTDRDYVLEQLTELGRAVSGDGDGVPAGVSSPNVGSSLIGDGLATCAGMFDDERAGRSRTVVLATDNEVAGDALYTVPEAMEVAAAKGAMVFAVMPKVSKPPHVSEMTETARTTSGDVIMLEPGEPTNVARLASAIDQQQRRAVMTLNQDRSYDLVAPGGLLFLLGLGGALAAVWRRP